MNNFSREEVIVLLGFIRIYQESSGKSFHSVELQGKLGGACEKALKVMGTDEEKLFLAAEILGSKIITLFNETFQDDQN